MLILYIIIIFANLFFSNAWNLWDYKVTYASSSGTAAELIKESWESVWSKYFYYNETGFSDAPRPRRGHSLHLIQTDSRSDYGGATYIVLFGGRDNNQKISHIPKTYNVKTINGTISFSTYDKKPVNPCDDTTGEYYSVSERRNCNDSTSIIDIGLIYNDVWAYKVCSSNSTPPERGFDSACNETGWEIWHSGANEGGCTIELGIEVCTVPSERFNHGSVMFADGCLYVYGGFSQRCADYCDDLWFFDIYKKSWRQVYDQGTLTKFYKDTYLEQVIQLDPKDVPVDNSTSKFAGPSKRWRHTMVAGEPYVDANDASYPNKQQFALFGGHRLWQGFSQENNQDNNWEQYITRPLGGYLNDLWLYTKLLDYSEPGLSFKTNNGKWKKLNAKEQCYSAAGAAWDTRNDVACTTTIPTGRAGHSSAFDSKRSRIWIFGGYNTYFPYLRTDGSGSGPGVTSVGTGGFIPYPGYNYFMNDLWFFDLNTSVWTEVVYPTDAPIPDARTDAVFLLMGDVFFLHGGFADNYIYDDMWYYNITSGKWLEKTRFVRPIYPTNCTDDFKYIQENNCTHLLWPKHLERDEFPPYEVLAYSKQDFYWPDPTNGPYFGIFDKNYRHSADYGTLQFSDKSPVGTPEVPYAATGPMQYTLKFSYSFNSTHSATLYERCTSAYAEPTRDFVLDGLHGRSNASIFIPVPRSRRPGWDGCRDRADNRTDLPASLQFVKPTSRYGHRGVFIEDSSEIIMYGGMAYYVEQPKTFTNSWASVVSSEMWYFNLFHCENNCSFNGDCFYGFCLCYTGFYGDDCSNISCPGTFCSYNPVTYEQNCRHACQAGYNHTDYDVYVQDIAKIPCTLQNPGEVNGICDGYGHSMCTPPFIGDDCSTKDCKSNCSFNGWCSIEYPVSRCMCTPGYFGEICEYKLCLNNCSYPNGICNITSGQCDCNMMYSPYNNTREFKPWGGEDCSYIFPYQ
eukprot:gene11787-15773_t